MGSMTDEPVFWAHLLAKRGLNNVGVLVEQSLVGETYIKSFRAACRDAGIRIAPRSRSPRPRRTSVKQCGSCTPPMWGPWFTAVSASASC